VSREAGLDLRRIVGPATDDEDGLRPQLAIDSVHQPRLAREVWRVAVLLEAGVTSGQQGDCTTDEQKATHPPPA